jgi:hypothetical protein
MPRRFAPFPRPIHLPAATFDPILRLAAEKRISNQVQVGGLAALSRLIF